MLRIEASGLGDVQDILHTAEAGTRDALRDAGAAAVSAAWVPALTAAAGTAQQRKLLVSGATATVTATGFDLIAGRGPALSGGLDASHWYAVDYGMTPKQRAAPRRKRTGPGGARPAAVIWVGRNLPSRISDGRVIFPTLREKAPEFVEAWVKGLLGQFDGTDLDVTDGDVLGQVSGAWR